MFNTEINSNDFTKKTSSMNLFLNCTKFEYGYYLRALSCCNGYIIKS